MRLIANLMYYKNRSLKCICFLVLILYILYMNLYNSILKCRIQFIYRLIDNLPCATRYDFTENQPQYEHGYRLGFVEKGVVSIFIPHFI